MKYRNYVICFDGTWNKHSSETNVWKLCKDLRRGNYKFSGEDGEYCTESYYLSGPGTSADMGILGGALALDLGDAIESAYAWISEKVINLRNSDEQAIPVLYVFGFSRGAYRAHMFSWLLHDVGIAKDFKIARPVARAWCGHDEKGVEDLISRSGRFNAPDIKMLGLWDVVSAPLDVHKHYKDGERSPLVGRVFHAMAANEHRRNFPVMKYFSLDPLVTQVWFPGAHSDVGGGYPPDERKLSDNVLAWMKCRAFSMGLDFVTPPQKEAQDMSAFNIKDMHDESNFIEKWFVRFNRRFEPGEEIHPVIASLATRNEGYGPYLLEVPPLDGEPRRKMENLA